MAKIGAKPASVLVDMGLYPVAPLKLFPYLVVTGPHAKKCDGNGLPSSAEIDSLERVLGATTAMLSGATAKKLLGTLTYNCERVNYYYVQDTVAVRRAINRMYENHLADYSYSLKIKYDPQWEVYRNFLYPDSAAKVWMSTNSQLSILMAHDADVTQPRNVSYTFAFPSAVNCSKFIDSVKARNYTTGTMFRKQDMGLEYRIDIFRQNSLRMDSIHANRSELQTLATPLNGFFFGIRSEVVLPPGK